MDRFDKEPYGRERGLLPQYLKADGNNPDDHPAAGWARNKVDFPRTSRQSMSFDSTAM